MLPGGVGAKRGQKRKAGGSQGRSGGRQRLALIVFLAIFALLFIGFAIAEGIGGPSVPSGAVAVVSGVPDDAGTVTQDEFDRALARSAAEGKLKKVPKPGDDKFDELKEAAMTQLLNQVWLAGEAEELGVSVTDKQVETELEKIKEQSFPTAAAYKKFLEESKFTQEDVDTRIRLQLLSTGIQEQIKGESPQASSAQIADYYEKEKATRFTTKESRDVRIIINEDKSEVEAAKKALEKDHSPAGWKTVAAKYSSDPGTKSKGGLQQGITEEFLPPSLKGPIFGSATGELVGPVKNEKSYLLIEVVKLTPEKTKTLAESRSEITSTLGQELQQEFFSEFVANYESKWRSRTTCASDYLVSQCDNYVGNGRPANAPPACFEADPKVPITECPAVVTLTQPALPGTVTALKPKGEPFVQRPIPEASAAAAGAGAVEGAPEEVEAEPEPEAAEPESSGE